MWSLPMNASALVRTRLFTVATAPTYPSRAKGGLDELPRCLSRSPGRCARSYRVGESATRLTALERDGDHDESPRLLRGVGGRAGREWQRDAPRGLHPATPYPGVSYRPYLEPGALRQMHGLPEQAFDMLVTLLARICDDPYDPCPARRPECRDGGSRTSATSDSSYSRWTKSLVWSAFSMIPTRLCCRSDCPAARPLREEVRRKRHTRRPDQPLQCAAHLSSKGCDWPGGTRNRTVI
jgi:hypothetical protein